MDGNGLRLVEFLRNPKLFHPVSIFYSFSTTLLSQRWLAAQRRSGVLILPEREYFVEYFG